MNHLDTVTDVTEHFHPTLKYAIRLVATLGCILIGWLANGLTNLQKFKDLHIPPFINEGLADLAHLAAVLMFCLTVYQLFFKPKEK